MNEEMLSAIYIGPCADVGKILLLPQIKEWIMIEELPKLDNVGNKDKRFDCFFLKLKKVFEMIGFRTSSKESTFVWRFDNEKTNVTVFYFHSITFPNIPEDALVSIKYYCTTVDTVINSGAPIDKTILKLCPNVKYYVTSGDGGDGCVDVNQIQYVLENECKCPFDCKECKKFGMNIKMYYLNDFVCSNLLFWNVLWNRDINEYKDKLYELVKDIKLVEINTKLREFFNSIVLKNHSERMKQLMDDQFRFSQIEVDNVNF